MGSTRARWMTSLAMRAMVVWKRSRSCWGRDCQWMWGTPTGILCWSSRVRTAIRGLLRLFYAEERISTHGIIKETHPYTTAAIVSRITLTSAVLFDLNQLSLTNHSSSIMCRWVRRLSGAVHHQQRSGCRCTKQHGENCLARYIDPVDTNCVARLCIDYLYCCFLSSFIITYETMSNLQ